MHMADATQTVSTNKTTALFKDRISMLTLCRDIAQARLLEEAAQPRWRPL